MNNSKLFYIGLNGFAGSGKDTVAKMLKTMLNREWENLEQCKKHYKEVYTNPTISATFNTPDSTPHDKVLCIAFADQLKNICASMFGIPVSRFYQNKSTAWIAINDDFSYTENKPDDEDIVTADEYYYANGEYDNRVWMSLRELLVYVGTYVLQQDINRNIFVNIVKNTVREEQFNNPNLKYVIVTDVRFNHELEYIHQHSGVTMTITRDNVQQLDNIAEHDLDDEESYSYIIENNEGYDELFEKVWNLIHDNKEFENIVEELYTRDDSNNYLRLINIEDNEYYYKLCSPFHVKTMYKTDGDITFIDPTGGPRIETGKEIQGTNLMVERIEFDDAKQQWIIVISRTGELSNIYY